MTHQKKVRKRSRDGMKAEASKESVRMTMKMKAGSVHHMPSTFLPKGRAKVSNFRLANAYLQDMNQSRFKDLQNDSTSSVSKINHPLH